MCRYSLAVGLSLKTAGAFGVSPLTTRQIYSIDSKRARRCQTSQALPARANCCDTKFLNSDSKSSGLNERAERILQKGDTAMLLTRIFQEEKRAIVGSCAIF